MHISVEQCSWMLPREFDMVFLTAQVCEGVNLGAAQRTGYCAA